MNIGNPAVPATSAEVRFRNSRRLLLAVSFMVL
jgi:hypothetical protein